MIRTFGCQRCRRSAIGTHQQEKTWPPSRYFGTMPGLHCSWQKSWALRIGRAYPWSAGAGNCFNLLTIQIPRLNLGAMKNDLGCLGKIGDEVWSTQLYRGLLHKPLQGSLLKQPVYWKVKGFLRGSGEIAWIQFGLKLNLTYIARTHLTTSLRVVDLQFSGLNLPKYESELGFAVLVEIEASRLILRIQWLFSGFSRPLSSPPGPWWEES